jgi:hypothetical protein
MIVSSKKKKWIQEATYFALGKTEGIINGREMCRSMVGCSAGYCPERY